MSRKSKHKNQIRSRRPPLSLLDKSIYWLGLFLPYILSLLFAFCFEDITAVIAFRDPSVVAYNSHASFLFVLPVLLYAEISASVYFISALESKQPIWGDRKIQYGKAPWAKDCFPLFDSRRKTVYIRPSKKRFRRRMLMLWSAGLLLCFLIAPLGFFGRDCLTQNNSVITYNMLNIEEPVSYATDDFSHLTVQTEYVSGYRTANYWKYGLTIKMTDGKSFTFSNRDFDSREPAYQEMCLNKMIEIKALFSPDMITIKGENNIEKVVDYLGLNVEQIQLLQKLFTG